MESVKYSTPSRFACWSLIIIFFGVLSLPTLESWIGFAPNVPLDENRRLAQFPNRPHDFAATLDWPSGFESYYSDHFGLRRQLIRLNNYIQIFCLETVPSRHVTVGEDGWLFLPFDGFTDTYTPIKTFKPEQIEYWAKEIKQHAEACHRRGIHYLLVIAPNKQSIYPEYLPKRIQKNWAPVTFDRFLSEVRFEAEVLDLREPLRSAKREERIYQKTDTHWNDRGAFIAAAEIAKHLRSIYPELPQPSRASYKEFIHLRQEGGDLSRLLGFQDRLREDKIEWMLSGPSSALSSPPNFSSQKPWPSGKTPMAFEQTRTTSAVSIVFTGDSFGPYLISFLKECFHRTACYWPNFPYDPDQTDMLERILDAEKPDVFVEEIVEREVGKLPQLFESRE